MPVAVSNQSRSGFGSQDVEGYIKGLEARDLRVRRDGVEAVLQEEGLTIEQEEGILTFHIGMNPMAMSSFIEHLRGYLNDRIIQADDNVQVALKFYAPVTEVGMELAISISHHLSKTDKARLSIAATDDDFLEKLYVARCDKLFNISD